MTLTKNLGHVRYPAAEALPALLTARVPVNGLCPTNLLTQARLSSRVHNPRNGEEWKRVMTNNPQAKLQATLELYIETKGEQIRGYKEKKMGGKSGETFDPPPLAEFVADAARSFADDTTGVGGGGGGPSGCCSRSGSRKSSPGYSEAGIVRKINLDITAMLLD